MDRIGTVTRQARSRNFSINPPIICVSIEHQAVIRAIAADISNSDETPG